MAWYSVGSSSTQLDAGSSSYSLLHSIYGSQASQLPFSDYDSEVSLDVTQSEHHVPPRLSPTLKRRLSRPKSSPASVIAAREQIRSRPTPAPARPGSALNRQSRPGSAARRIVHGRPASAAVGKRPTSAASTVRGGASPNRRRPKTAMGFVSATCCFNVVLSLSTNPLFYFVRSKGLQVGLGVVLPHCCWTWKKKKS